MRRIKIARNHVHGALKCYSSPCFEAIGGVQERLGWDTIDETYARMRGFDDASATPTSSRIHHRRSAAPTARCAATRATASAPTSRTTRSSWVALRALQASARRRPTGLSGLAFIYGYVPRPRPGGSSGSRTPSTAASRGVRCAGGCSAPSFHTTKEQR